MTLARFLVPDYVAPATGLFGLNPKHVVLLSRVCKEFHEDLLRHAFFLASMSQPAYFQTRPFGDGGVFTRRVHVAQSSTALHKICLGTIRHVVPLLAWCDVFRCMRVCKTMRLAMLHHGLDFSAIRARGTVLAVHDGPVLRIRWSGGEASGLRWRSIGASKPINGKELSNEGLASALATALHKRENLKFTRAQWVAFGIPRLLMDDFVKAEGTYFGPYIGTKCYDCLGTADYDVKALTVVEPGPSSEYHTMCNRCVQKRFITKTAIHHTCAAAVNRGKRKLDTQCVSRRIARHLNHYELTTTEDSEFPNARNKNAMYSLKKARVVFEGYVM